MVFRMCFGQPGEIRTIAAFAMGIRCRALAGFQRWRLRVGSRYDRNPLQPPPASC